MLTKYKFISKEQYINDIKHNILILESTLKHYIDSNIKTIVPNTIIFTNCKETINSIEHSEFKLPIHVVSNYNILIKNNKVFTIYKSINSFDQNNSKLANNIRNYIINEFTSNLYKLTNNTNNNYNIYNIGIGGEYYLYQYILSFINKYDNFLSFTNNKYIFDDAEYNYSRILKNYKYQYANVVNIEHYLLESYTELIFDNSIYETINIKKIINKLIKKNIKLDIIINLAKLNVNVLEFISLINININTLIIISCKENDFNNKKVFLPYIIKKNIKSKCFIDTYLNQKITVYTFNNKLL